MSVLIPGDLGPSSKTDSPENSQTTYAATNTYDEHLFDDFLGFGEHHAMMETATTTRASPDVEAPPLPEKNLLRSSRLLDNLGLKLGGSLETQELGQTTPHDLYLSSEEDGSSSADDFSDYDWDSSSEEGVSPTRRRSHEDTAGVVSVIFSGKPCIVDLPPSRRPTSPSSSSYKSSTTSSRSETRSINHRPKTSADSLNSTEFTVPSSRKSSIVSELFIGKKRPPFLNIDPYANGSTYSLDQLGDDVSHPAAGSPVKTPRTPRTPTALLKGVTRTISLVRKRSRPNLHTNFAATASRDNLASPAISPLKQQQLAAGGQVTSATGLTKATAVRPQTAVAPPPEPVTYSDIIKAAKKNAKAQHQQQQPPPASPLKEEAPESPASPNESRKSFLGGLAARRRSIKIINGRLM